MAKRCMFGVILTLVAVMIWYTVGNSAENPTAAQQTTITLPAVTTSTVTVEQAMRQRRSVRSYANEPLTLQQVSQLLWAAQGITEPTKGLRTAPSAMAMYPLRVYLIANNVRDLPAGVYRYIPQGHKIELVQAGDQHTNIGGQPQMQSAPVLIVYAADETQAIARAGEKRARQWTDIEVGHSAQNVLLEEIAQGLVGVGMGGFDEAKMRSVLQLPASQTLIYVVSAGKPK